jgi:eukaryotic-like serine/threonine-protein kinase
VTGGRAATRIAELVGAKYRIVRLLAQGGMGVVYEAQHTVVRRRFAVKFLRRDLAERRDILTRFHHEAEAAGALESENVAAAVDFGIAEDGAPYIVMEYLVGESLTALLAREGRLPVGRAADLVVQAARGIQVAHAAGIIHRDLKPQNLFVCRRQDGTDLLKVLDFGVAKLQAADEMNAATRTGAMVGTVAYMSPEQARGDKIVDARSDVYALGAILYELCAGSKPHPGESPNAILHHIATQPAAPLGSVAPDLPAALADIVARALDAAPEVRPASAEALAEALAPFANREVWPAPKLDDSGAGRAEASPQSPVLAAPQRRARRWRAIAGGATAVGLLALGAARLGLHGSGAASVPAQATALAPLAPLPAIAHATLSATTVPAASSTTAASSGGGAGGASLSHHARRHALAVSPLLPAAPDSPTPAAKQPAVPVTFDQQNPYE